MFNVTVIRLRDLIKYPVIIIIAILIIYFPARYFLKEKKLDKEKLNIGNKAETILNKYILYPIEEGLPIINNINEVEVVKNQKNNDIEKENFVSYMLDKAFKLQFGEVNVKNIDNTDKSEINEENDKKEELTLASKNTKTEVVTKNPIVEKYTYTYKTTKIKNETDYKLTDNMLNPKNLKIDNSNVIIFHTHTCESYTQSEKYKYKATGNFRTTDLNYSVARVGDELTKYLTNYKFNVTHNKSYHDYPAYNGSYTRSLNTVEKILKNKKSDIIIDLHRDAIGSKSTYAPTVKINNDYCAQIMFVIGTNGGGLKHPNWKSNLQFAVKIQEEANKLYPGLFKPIILRNSRYNQHLGKAACIIEVGATGNTLDQCLNTMKYLSNVMNETLKK